MSLPRKWFGKYPRVGWQRSLRVVLESLGHEVLGDAVAFGLLIDAEQGLSEVGLALEKVSGGFHLVYSIQVRNELLEGLQVFRGTGLQVI